MRLSERKAFWAILITIWLYTLFVGATPTVIRAAVMGAILVVGQRLERRAHAWTTLLAACWAMMLWDLGFQLSALATASLFAYGKGTERLLLHTPLRDAITSPQTALDVTRSPCYTPATSTIQR